MEHRTGTHVHTHTVRMKKRSFAVTAAVVLLSIVLIAGIITLSPLGDYLTEHVFQPVVAFFGAEKKEDRDIVSALKTQEQSPQASTAPTPSATPAENSLHIVETPYYLLEMGVFTEQAQAKEHAEKIRAMGAGGMICQEGSLYRVFAAAYRDEESLKKVQSQVRTDGFEATPYITEQNSVLLKLKGDAKAVKATESAVDMLSEIPDTLCDLSLAFDRQSIGGDDLRKTLQELNTQLDGVLKTLGAMPADTVDPLKNVLQNYADRISTFLKEHDTIRKENACDLKMLQIGCIIDYIQLFERN